VMAKLLLLISISCTNVLNAVKIVSDIDNIKIHISQSQLYVHDRNSDTICGFDLSPFSRSSLEDKCINVHTFGCLVYRLLILSTCVTVSVSVSLSASCLMRWIYVFC
jgi:hypothetical protein